MKTSKTLLKQTITFLATATLFLFLIGTPASAALNVYAELTANGAAIDGETTTEAIGGVDVSSDHIEIHAFNHEDYNGTDRASGQLTGRLTHTPVKFVKRIDKSSPLLQRAISQNEVVAGTFKFFRNNTATGEVEHYYTITVSQGRLSGIRSWTPNNLDAAGANFPFMEEVSIVYGTIAFRDEIHSTEHIISVGGAQ